MIGFSHFLHLPSWSSWLFPPVPIPPENRSDGNTKIKRCERQRPKSPAEMCWRSRSKLPLAQSYHPRHPTKMVRSNNSNPPRSSAHWARPRVDPPVPPRWRRLAAPGIWWRQPRPKGLNTPRRLPWDGEFAHREVKLYQIVATLNKIELIKVFSRCYCIVDSFYIYFIFPGFSLFSVFGGVTIYGTPKNRSLSS